MKKDLNDRLLDGSLPDDPFAGKVVSDDVPRIYGERDMLGSVPTVPDRETYGTTGHWKLDEYTGGLRPGEVWLLGADTSWGKSSFAVMVYDECKRVGKRVLIVSAEDSLATYGARLLRRRARIPAQLLRQRRLDAGHHTRIAAARAESELNAAFIDARGRTVEWLVPSVARAIKEFRFDVVIFDYLGAFECKLAQQDRRNMTRYVARVMTDCVKAAGVCGVLMSQLTLNEEDKIPGKLSYRDSKDLLQMAEVGAIGFIAPDDDGENCVKGDRCVKLVKVKEGEGVGKKVRLNWHPTIACFDPTLEPEDKLGGFYDNERAYTQTPGEELIERSLFGYRDE